VKQIVLGTAGHIDHGKTSLIKAMTGINTDRLKEEQARGITIELGFASMMLSDGQLVGIVDVPGHEKFVKTMVAGASGIDVVLMIIAADEGIMPQTREHLEICSLLGIRYGLIVMTKIDLVDQEWKELVQEDIREFVRGTFLENAPIVPVSSATGDGIPEMVQVLEEVCRDVPERSPSSIFRLPVDRVFTMKGFGTVITGTLISGQVHLGELVMLYPSRITSKVRGIQVHNSSVETARSGMRTAVNFQGLDKASVNRGDILSSPNALFPSYMVDVSFSYLSSNRRALKNRTRIRFHTGTSEILGNLILLDREEVQPGDTVVAQARLDTPVAVIKDDRYVIRSYSPVRTIGGGGVLNPIPPKHKRFRPDIVEGLVNLPVMSPEEMVSYRVREYGNRGVSFAQLRIMTSIPDKKLETGIQNLLSRKEILMTDRENRMYLHSEHFNGLMQEMIQLLEQFHRGNPLKPGMSKEELKSRLPGEISPRLFQLLISDLGRNQKIVLEENIIRLATHVISLGADQSGIREKILRIYLESGLTPPYFKEFCKNESLDPSRAKEVLMLLVDEGQMVRIKDDLFFHSRPISAIRQELVAFLNKNGEITTPQFKELTGISRKYLIPLIEYFDSKNVTIRVGDIRKLRNG
jgi:selenocysteine-specific elongation factor